MNHLIRLRRGSSVNKMIPFKILLYCGMLSEVTTVVDSNDDVWGVCKFSKDELLDQYPTWTAEDINKALKELTDDGLIFVGNKERIYLGEMRGRRLFPFEKESSLYDDAKKLVEEHLNRFSKSSSALRTSRGMFLRSAIEGIQDKGHRMTAGDLTNLHGYLYELYTGGEIYTIRNKTEVFQTTNMLKAYDTLSVFALLVFGVLDYDTYKSKGSPTLTNVAMMKDDVFKSLTRSSVGSKEYMREKNEERDGF